MQNDILLGFESSVAVLIPGMNVITSTVREFLTRKVRNGTTLRIQSESIFIHFRFLVNVSSPSGSIVVWIHIIIIIIIIIIIR